MSQRLLGTWFAYLEATRGERVEIAFAREDSGTLHWVHHGRADAPGAFAEIQRGLGRRVHWERPRRVSRPPGIRAFRALARTPIYREESEPTRWRSWDPGWRRVGHAPSDSLRECIFLTREQTEALERAAASSGVSLNSWLIHRGHARVLPRFLATSPERPLLWMLPVSLRTAGERVDPENQVVQIPVPIDSSLSPGQVHARVRDVLKVNVQGAMGWGAEWVARLPPPWLARLMERDLARIYGRSSTLGAVVFSNLGTWEDPTRPRGVPESEGWAFFPPPLKIQPLVLAALEFNGRLGLSIGTHPSLASSSSELRDALEAWWNPSGAA